MVKSEMRASGRSHGDELEQLKLPAGIEKHARENAGHQTMTTGAEMGQRYRVREHVGE